MKYDIIIIACSKTDELIRMTQNCIDSAQGENVIIVETGKLHEYRGVNHTVYYSGDFNYNRALNIGLKYAENDIQVLCNNDILFCDGWKSIGETMRNMGYLSASALSNDPCHVIFNTGEHLYEGYDIGYYVTGWCIFVDKKLWDIIGDLSEEFKFWYSDNAYADQLKEAKVKHVIICNVRVEHLGSQTLTTLPPQQRRHYQSGEKSKYLSRSIKIDKGGSQDEQIRNTSKDT